MHKFSRTTQYQCSYCIDHLDYVLNLRSLNDLCLLSKVEREKVERLEVKFTLHQPFYCFHDQKYRTHLQSSC